VLFSLAHVARLLNIPVQTEPRVDFEDRKRADGFFAFSREHAAIDVSVTHPMCKSYVSSAASRPLGAASTRERLKNMDYGERFRGQGVQFWPFVIETMGGIGKEASLFIKAMARDAFVTGASQLIPGNVESFIKKAVSAALQVGNALVFMEAKRRIKTRGIKCY